MVEKYDLKLEDQLLLNCSLTQLSDENIKMIKQITNQDLDWNYLIDLAYKHRLSPLLYWQLNKIVPEKIPSDLKYELQENFRHNVNKNLAMFKELVEVIHCLQKHGINPIPYKGPVLAIMTYKNLGFRSFGDLDFYVDLKDVLLTKKILIDEGFKPWLELSCNQEKAFYKFQREYHFTNKETGIIIEIKWRLLSTLHAIKHEPFFNNSSFLKEVELDQFKIKTISTEPLILILSIHNASHLFSSLYRFCDISELIKSVSKVDWRYLMKMAIEMGVKRIFLINLLVLSKLFKIELPEYIIQEINQDKRVTKITLIIINQLFYPKSWGLFEKIVFIWYLREKKQDKLRVMLVMMFLPTPGVIGGLSLPTTLESFYYVIRFLEMLKNIAK